MPFKPAIGALLIGGLALLHSRPTQASYGFYVAGADTELFSTATRVVLMRDGRTTVVSIQPEVLGPLEDFAMVIPVPAVLQDGDVQTLRRELFERLETLSAPRLVEYWERDPCYELPPRNELRIGMGGGGGTGSGYGRGTGAPFQGPVATEAEFAVGEYEITILSATESEHLDRWLRTNHYQLPADAEPLLRPYVEQGMKFFVAKIDPAKVEVDEAGRAMLSPLRFHYESERFDLPVRIGLINAPDPTRRGNQDMLVYVLAPGTRYRVANYPNVTIPTDLDLQPAAKDGFGEFYISLFDHVLAQNPGAVVTEYAWQASSCRFWPNPGAGLTRQELVDLGGDVLANRSQGLGTAGTAEPRIHNRKVEVIGAMDPDRVRGIVRGHSYEVRSCYASGLKRDPTLAGDLTVGFRIRSDGKVESAAVADPTGLDDAAVVKCFVSAVGRWTFLQPEDGNVVEVRYPFVLSPDTERSELATDRFVLTRLHARSDSGSLGDDLVFEPAEAITGGSEQGAKIERGATPSSKNEFEAHYAIRHPWAGELACEAPRRGYWHHRPPEGEAPAPMVFVRLAEVTRGDSLASFVTESTFEQLGLSLDGGHSDPGTPPPSPSPPGCACSGADEPGRPMPPVFGLAILAALFGRRDRLQERE